MFFFCLILFYSDFLLILSLVVLLITGYLTLVERHILGLSQVRVGPLKVGLFSLIQPIMDAFKLLFKSVNNFSSFKFIFISSLLLFFSLCILLWSFLPPFSIFKTAYSVLGFLVVSSFAIGPVIVLSWMSSSRYSSISTFRSVSLMISYEVCFSFILIVLLYASKSFNWIISQNDFWCLNFFVFVLVFIMFMSELNRVPFDLSEGESELVAGYQTEFVSGLFTLLFLSEYVMILVLCYVCSILVSSYFYFSFFTFLFFFWLVFALLYLV